MKVLVWNWVRYSDEIWKRIVKLQRNKFYFSQMNILAINVTWNKLVNKTRTFCKNLQCKVHLKSNCVTKYLIIYIKPEIVSYITHFLLVLVFWGTLSFSRNKFVLPNWQQYFCFISWACLHIHGWNISFDVVATAMILTKCCRCSKTSQYMLHKTAAVFNQW